MKCTLAQLYVFSLQHSPIPSTFLMNAWTAIIPYLTLFPEKQWELLVQAPHASAICPKNARKRNGHISMELQGARSLHPRWIKQNRILQRVQRDCLHSKQEVTIKTWVLTAQQTKWHCAAEITALWHSWRAYLLYAHAIIIRVNLPLDGLPLYKS